MRVRTTQMLVFVAAVAGGPWVLSARFGQLADFDFRGWMALGGFAVMIIGIVVGCLQRILHRRLILTPTELVVPSSWMSRRMTAILRSSITKCQIVLPRRRYRTLLVFHRRGQFSVSEDQLPRNAALDEIFDNLANELNPRWHSDVVAARALLAVKYTDYINWPAPIAVSIIASIVALAAFEPSGKLFRGFPWAFAAAFVVYVVAWAVIINSRKGRLVMTRSTLSAPVFPGSKDPASIGLSSIRQLEVTYDELESGSSWCSMPVATS